MELQRRQASPAAPPRLQRLQRRGPVSDARSGAEISPAAPPKPTTCPESFAVRTFYKRGVSAKVHHQTIGCSHLLCRAHRFDPDNAKDTHAPARVIPVHAVLGFRDEA